MRRKLSLKLLCLIELTTFVSLVGGGSRTKSTRTSFPHPCPDKDAVLFRPNTLTQCAVNKGAFPTNANHCLKVTELMTFSKCHLQQHFLISSHPDKVKQPPQTSGKDEGQGKLDSSAGDALFISRFHAKILNSRLFSVTKMNSKTLSLTDLDSLAYSEQTKFREILAKTSFVSVHLVSAEGCVSPKLLSLPSPPSESRLIFPHKGCENCQKLVSYDIFLSPKDYETHHRSEVFFIPIPNGKYCSETPLLSHIPILGRLWTPEFPLKRCSISIKEVSKANILASKKAPKLREKDKLFGPGDRTILTSVLLCH